MNLNFTPKESSKVVIDNLVATRRGRSARYKAERPQFNDIYMNEGRTRFSSECSQLFESLVWKNLERIVTRYLNLYTKTALFLFISYGYKLICLQNIGNELLQYILRADSKS